MTPVAAVALFDYSRRGVNAFIAADDAFQKQTYLLYDLFTCLFVHGGDFEKATRTNDKFCILLSVSRMHETRSSWPVLSNNAIRKGAMDEQRLICLSAAIFISLLEYIGDVIHVGIFVRLLYR